MLWHNITLERSDRILITDLHFMGISYAIRIYVFCKQYIVLPSVFMAVCTSIIVKKRLGERGTWVLYIQSIGMNARLSLFSA